MVFLLAGLGWGLTKVVHYTESPQFCSSCHKVMDPAYLAWEKGEHNEVKCVECHADRGAVGYVKSKIRGAKELYAWVATDISAKDLGGLEVPNRRCENCHQDIYKNEKFGGLIFPHKEEEHESLSCQTCHPSVAHTNQDKYFGEYGNTWDVKTCASCHNGKETFSIAKGGCTRCHPKG